jgi:hypothetical protein
MNQNLLRRRFVVTKLLPLNEIARLMKIGEGGFAYVPTEDPVRLEIDTFEYTASSSNFESCTMWANV